MGLEPTIKPNTERSINGPTHCINPDSLVDTSFSIETIAPVDPIREIIKLIKPEAIAVLKEASLSKNIDGEDSFKIRFLTKEGPAETSVLVFLGESHLTLESELLLCARILEHFPQRAVEEIQLERYLFGQTYFENLTKSREEHCKTTGLKNMGAITLGRIDEKNRGTRLGCLVDEVIQQLQSEPYVEINLREYQLDESDLRPFIAAILRDPLNNQSPEDKNSLLSSIAARETVLLEQNIKPKFLEHISMADEVIGRKIGSYIVSDFAINSAGLCALTAGFAIALHSFTNMPYSLPIAQFTGLPALAYSGFIGSCLLLRKLGIIDIAAKPIRSFFDEKFDRGRESAMTECIRELDKQDNLKWPRLIQTGMAHTDKIIEQLISQDSWLLTELSDIPDCE